MSETTKERSQFSLWVQATRPFAFPASVVPVLVGTMLALYLHEGNLNWFLLPLALIAGMLFQAGTNLVSEYNDYKKGVDREESFGSSRILVDKLMNPKTVLMGGYITFGIGFVLGLVMVYFVGLPLLYLGLIGLVGGLLYTGKPIAYKYYALGDILVFSLMGPLMVLGAYMVLTGKINWDVLWISIPVGFLVTAILHANNLRDIMHDSKAKIKTMAMLFGEKGSKLEYYFLVIGAFVSVALMVGFQVLEPWALIVFLSLPPAIKNIQMVSKAEVNNPEVIMMADVRTAQHHLMFGVLFSIGILLGAII